MITDFKDLFNEITYAYDPSYPPTYHKDDDTGIEYIEFYKLCLSSDGIGAYKADYWDFDQKLWPRVKLLFKLFEDTKTIDILYGK